MSTASSAVALRRSGSWLRRSRRLGAPGLVSLIVLALIVLMAIAAPLLSPESPNEIDFLGVWAGPSAAHPLGQDGSGRDLVSRLIMGSRSALLAPFIVVAGATVFGTALALVAVWVGGWIDTVIVRIIDAIFAFPGLLIAILATALFGSGLGAATVALVISYIPYIARVVRSAALRERAMPYVEALVVQGVSAVAICLRHILPNVVRLILANATVSFGFALLDLAGLSFLGLGVQPPSADWGAMIGDGMSGVLQHAPEEALSAGLLIVITVICTNMLSDRLAGGGEQAR